MTEVNKHVLPTSSKKVCEKANELHDEVAEVCDAPEHSAHAPYGLLVGKPNDFERFVLRIDNYINLQYQIIANRLGYIVGFCSYVLIAWLVFARAIPISPRFFLFLMIAPFPIIFGFVKFNFALWVLPRRLELGLKKKPLNGCDCDVNRLPLYGEVGWLSARFKEFYTCILYGFICRLLLTYCFSTVCVFIFFGFFN